MTLVIIIGAPAVGKMTVGQELAKCSDFKMFHNHMTIEMVAPFFSYSTPQGRALVQDLRATFFDAFARDHAGNYVFTYVWAFGSLGERAYIEGIAAKFEDEGHSVIWVELTATQAERVKRNKTENRLLHKPTKRDLAWSENYLLETDRTYRVVSVEGEIAQGNCLHIDTNDMRAAQVAAQILNHLRIQSTPSVALPPRED